MKIVLCDGWAPRWFSDKELLGEVQKWLKEERGQDISLNGVALRTDPSLIKVVEDHPRQTALKVVEIPDGSYFKVIKAWGEGYYGIECLVWSKSPIDLEYARDPIITEWANLRDRGIHIPLNELEERQEE